MRRTSLTLLALALLFAPATAAMAKQSTGGSDRAAIHLPAMAQFKLSAPNGFRASVEAFGRDVALTLSREGQFAIYRVRGAVTADGDVDARFGSLGRISVDFEPDPVERDPCLEAQGKDGVFTGTISFTGEHHYVSLKEDRVRGSAYSPTEAKGCGARRPSPPPPSEIEGEEAEAEDDTASLAIYGPRKRRILLVLGSREPDRRFTYFIAVTGERRGRMHVSRGIQRRARSSAFVFDSALTTATVHPPKPFQGDGFFQRNPDGSTTWTGTLRAPILGAGPLVFAAPSFSASMVRDIPGE
jgi:hypothetical protein